MQKLMWINKPLGVGWGEMTALHCESETHLHPTLSQSSEGKGFQRQPRAARHSWSPCNTPPPLNSPAPEGQGGTPWGLSAWTLTLDTCTGLAGPVFSASTLCHEGHKLAGRGSQYPSLAGQAR